MTTWPPLKTATSGPGLIAGLFLFVVLFAFPAASWAGPNLDFLDDDYLYEEEEWRSDPHEQWEYLENGISSPFQDVPPDHWAYESVKELAEMGFLEGYEGDFFEGDRPLTRYEMAVLVNKILKTFLRWKDSGRIVKYKTVKVREEPPPSPAAPPAPESVIPPPASSHGPRPEKPMTLPPVSMDKDVAATSPSGGQVFLTKKGPIGMTPIGEGEDDRSLQPPAPGGASGPSRQSRPSPAKPSAPGAPVKPNEEFKEEKVQVEEEAEITKKVQDMIEELSNTFKKELKDLDRTIGREIKDLEKIALTNERQIERLQQEDERFKITGSDDFEIEINGNYDPPWDEGAKDDYYGEQTGMRNTLRLSFTSNPDPQQDLTISATTKAETILGTRTGYYGYIDGTNTAFSVDEFNIRYSDSQVNRKNPRNFKLRELGAGNIAVNYSPLTMYGYKLQGLNLSLKLNDYTLNMFGGRLAYHYPIFLGNMHYHKPGDDTQYDRYAYGANLQTSVFGEPKSMGNIQKLFIYDNDKTNYYGRILPQEGGFLMECEPGSWVEMQFDNDPAGGVDAEADESYKDLFCLPPEKNSITSAFVRYPVINNIYITAEYAHSTYYKPGYAAIQSPNYLPPDTYDSLKDELDIEDDQQMLDQYGYQECDTDDLGEKYTGCWFWSKERRDQDDGFLLLFDYNEGPVQIFPVGYARLGSEFVTKYFGLPGMDINSLMGGGGDGGGGGLAFLPIAIQSLEAYIARFTYDRLRDKDYEFSTLYVWGNEIRPMYIDPGLVMYGLSSRKDKGATNVLLANFVTKLNTRRETLRLSAWNNSLKYNISDNMSLTLGYTRAKVKLPKTCLDGDQVKLTDDYGNVYYNEIGDGIYDCANGEYDALLALDLRVDNQSMELAWRTSKDSELTTKFSTMNLQFSFDYSVSAVVDLIEDLVPRGKYWTFEQNYKYRLTETTSLDFIYKKEYDRVEDEYSVDNYKYPTIDSHVFKFKLSTTF